MYAHARAHSGSPQSQRSDGESAALKVAWLSGKTSIVLWCLYGSEGSRLSKLEDTSTVDMLQRLHSTAIAMRHFSHLFGPPSQKLGTLSPNGKNREQPQSETSEIINNLKPSTNEKPKVIT